jgi:hypothetical protein
MTDDRLAHVTTQDLDARNGSCRARYGTFSECPLCGAALIPEHAHFKCRGCGWRDSCCD